MFADSLKYCQEHKGLEIAAWCIMPSHVHLVMGTKANAMQDIMRDLKSFTSRSLKEEIIRCSGESRRKWMSRMMEDAGQKNNNNNQWQLWQQNNHPIELYSNKMIDQTIDYTHMNPVKAGFVIEPYHWKFTSAIDYSGGKGLIDICYPD